jgi:hypothetical protein
MYFGRTMVRRDRFVSEKYTYEKRDLLFAADFWSGS